MRLTWKLGEGAKLPGEGREVGCERLCLVEQGLDVAALGQGEEPCEDSGRTRALASGALAPGA